MCCAQGIHHDANNYPQPRLDGHSAVLNIDQPKSSSHNSALQETSKSADKKSDVEFELNMSHFANLHYLAAFNEGFKH